MNIKLIWLHLQNIWSSPAKQHLLEKELAETKQRLDRMSARVTKLEDLMAEHLVIGADLGAVRHHRNYVIVMGRYRKHDYVRTFEIRDDDFTGVVDSLKSIDKRYGHPSKFIDAPPNCAHFIHWELDRDR